MPTSSNSSRRSFIGASAWTAGSIAAGMAAPAPWLQALAMSPAQRQDRILVVLQLSGGNDGLNTVIPYRDDEYRRARPTLAIPPAEVLKLNDDLGLHPSLAGVADLFEAGRMSIIQGVGYESPNRSHFESMDIWHSCHRKADRSNAGWLGRYLAEADQAASLDAMALHLGHEQLPLALIGRGVQVPSIASLEQFKLQAASDERIEAVLAASVNPKARDSSMSKKPKVAALAEGEHIAAPELFEFLAASSRTALAASERLNKVLSEKSPTRGLGKFPDSQLAEKLQIVSRLILAGLTTRIYYVALDGFDTHSLQPQGHAALLRQWSEALTAFMACMEETGQSERVLVLTFSEFGRRVQENASQGTDHGAAAPVFLTGAHVNRPLHGQMPSLLDLVDGDQKFHTDFRRIYATLLENWFSAASGEILGGTHRPLDVLRSMG